MVDKLLIYGATGYTGRLVAKRAKEIGLDFEIGGRNAEKLRPVADELDVPFRAFSLDDRGGLRSGIAGFSCVLLCAGPFRDTASQTMDACIDLGVHYLDIAAEFGAFEAAESRSARALRAGVMLMPGVGWDVVPSDCLALHTAWRVDNPRRLRLALKVLGGFSRGSVMSSAEIFRRGTLVRREGEVVENLAPQPFSADFGQGVEKCVPLPFGDVVTAWRSTGIPNIETFLSVSEISIPTGDLDALPDGPTPEERGAARSYVLAEVEGGDGSIARSLVETPSGYDFTPVSAIEIARRVLRGGFRPGFETPASLYGSDLLTSIADSQVTDLGDDRTREQG